MRFPSPLLPGTLIRRYKRFFADIRLADGTEITAHCPNPGAMLGLKDPGLDAWVSVSNDPKRKLKHTLELVRAGDALVGINTLAPNRLVAEALDARLLAPFANYTGIRREVPYGDKSRVDFLLEGDGLRRCYLEIKNVHLCRTPGLAEFPDSVTARGARHMAELADMAAQGHRAALLYVVQRDDCAAFTLARDIDPAYARAFDAAVRGGLEVLCFACRLTTDEILIGRQLPIRDVGG